MASSSSACSPEVSTLAAVSIGNLSYSGSIDTAASVLTSGLLGEQFIGLQPGAEEEYLKDGSEVELTQSALVLEQIVGQFLYSKAEE